MMPAAETLSPAPESPGHELQEALDALNAEAEAWQESKGLPPIAIDDDGCCYHPVTGELYDPDELAAIVRAAGVEQHSPRPSPAITTREEADEALRRRAEIEARLVALKARLDAVTDNLGRQIRCEQRRIRWWEVRNQPGILDVARRMLGRTRTAQFDHGRVEFRTSPGSNSIVDMEAAVRWMEAWAPEAVRRPAPTVNIPDVLKARKVVERETESTPVLPFLASSGPRETFTIKTGVGEKEARRGN